MNKSMFAVPNKILLMSKHLGQAALNELYQDTYTSLLRVHYGVGVDLPFYTVTGHGPDHSPNFAATVTIKVPIVDGKEVRFDVKRHRATGPSKKIAQNKAAVDAIESLNCMFGHEEVVNQSPPSVDTSLSSSQYASNARVSELEQRVNTLEQEVKRLLDKNKRIVWSSPTCGYVLPDSDSVELPSSEYSD